MQSSGNALQEGVDVCRVNAFTNWRRLAMSAEQLLMDEQAERIAALEALLREALDSRGPDYIEAAHPGWHERARRICEID
jgi:hypothetical protein